MELSGDWVNQNGSVLCIGPVDEGGFSGTFMSAKGRAARGKRYPVSGVVNGKLVAFAVDFRTGDEDLSSISNFTGRVEGEVMHTLWVLARQFEDAARTKPTQPWNTFLVNADRFERQE